MKTSHSRHPRAMRLKSQDLTQMNEPSAFEIQKLYSRLNLSDLKLADLLSKVQKFSNDLLVLLESWKLPSSESEKIHSDLSHFLSINDASSPASLFLKFKQELLERLNCRELNKESLKSFIVSGISELTAVSKLSAPNKRKSLNLVEDKLELTPVRNTRRSVSPGDRVSGCLFKENSELKANLAEVAKERDLLKVWKDNLIKHPNLDLDVQKIVKDLEEESDLNAVKSQCFMSKLNYIVNATYKFLNNTSKFQKVIRGGEGYPSCTFYEDEKAKLEVKLREVIENNEKPWKPPNSPLRTHESERRLLKTPEQAPMIDLRKKSRELPVYYNEKINNKLIEEISKQYNDRIDHLSSTVNRLESDNRKLKNKYFLVKKEMKAIKTTENQKKVEIFETFFQQQSIHLTVFKKSFVRQFNLFNNFIEKVLQNVSKSLEEKLLKISEIQPFVSRLLDRNKETSKLFNEESAKHSELVKDYEAQVMMLELSLSEQKESLEAALKSIQSNLNISELSKKKLESQVRSLEAEVSAQAKDRKSWKDAETLIVLQKEKIALLELKVEENSSLGESLEKNENALKDLKVRNELLLKENEILAEALAEKSKELLRSEELVKLQEESIETLRNLEKGSLSNPSLFFTESSENPSKPSENPFQVSPELSTSSSLKIPLYAKPSQNPSSLQSFHSKLLDSKDSDLKSALIFAQINKELVECELFKVRSNYQSLEHFLRQRLVQEARAEVFMSRLDLNNY